MTPLETIIIVLASAACYGVIGWVFVKSNNKNNFLLSENSMLRGGYADTAARSEETRILELKLQLANEGIALRETVIAAQKQMISIYENQLSEKDNELTFAWERIERLILNAIDRERTIDETKEKLKNYLNPALADQLLEMTQPDVPRSPTQRYRLTSKGQAVVARCHLVDEGQ